MSTTRCKIKSGLSVLIETDVEGGNGAVNQREKRALRRLLEYEIMESKL